MGKISGAVLANHYKDQHDKAEQYRLELERERERSRERINDKAKVDAQKIFDRFEEVVEQIHLNSLSQNEIACYSVPFTEQRNPWFSSRSSPKWYSYYGDKKSIKRYECKPCGSISNQQIVLGYLNTIVKEQTGIDEFVVELNNHAVMVKEEVSRSSMGGEYTCIENVERTNIIGVLIHYRRRC